MKKNVFNENKETGASTNSMNYITLMP